MKPTTTSLSIFLGIFAATVAAQTTDAALPEASPAVTVEPLTADDGSAVVDQFPVPIEMAKRDQQSYRERLVTSLTKRHYGTFTCSTAYNNYCKQFLSQDGVGGLVGCVGTTCYVGCGVSGYTRTNNVNDICVNYNTDVSNCGSDNNVCQAGTNGTPVCNSGTCSVTCATGYALSGTNCVNTNTDVNNCGAAGNTCPAVANGTPICSAGTCSATCSTGYTLSSGKCINTNTDVNNCGAAGKTCPAVANGTPICSGGSCSATCSTGYTLSSGACVNTNTDVNNCGGAGKTCPAVANGTPICSAGTCSATCSTGYTLSSGKCVNTNTDVNNCGGAGKTCPAVANGTPVCNSGTCSATCSTGYTLSSGACVNTNTDVNNCGGAGKICPAVANGTPICSAGSCSATCATGYTLSGGKCINTNTDVNNCGGAGKTCPAVANGTPICSAGSCSATCSTGYALSGGQCVNTNTDVNNCGGAGKTCPAVTNGTPICSAGSCSATCNSGYSLTNGACTLTCKDGSVLVNGKCGRVTGCTTNADCISGTGNANSYCYLSSDGNACFTGSTNSAGSPTGAACGYSSNLAGDDNGCATGLVCLNHVCTATTTNDPNNCGSTGNVCPTPSNGARTCQAGTCGITCNTGYTASGSTCVNTQNDASNCGTAGNKCSATGTGVSGATCVSGSCQVTCSSGYNLSSDKKSCSSVCADGSYLNGLTCSRYSCSTTAQCQSQTGRTDSACFNGVCYTASTNSGGLPAGSSCGLLPISGGDDNQCAAGLVCVYYTCYNANNPSACGASRTVCPTPANGVATCTVGTCGFTCKTGYMVNTAGTACVLNPSSKTKKKRSQAGPELCPKGETACPIAGSASFGSFVNSSDRVKDFAHSLGGYECIDTGSDLQSCGGCASLGTGYDCTRIAHAADVGCSNGKCVLFGCRKGYVPALDAEKCIKVEETHKQRSAHLRQRAMRRKDISH